MSPRVLALDHFAQVVPSIEIGIGAWQEAFDLPLSLSGENDQLRAALLSCRTREIELLQGLDPNGSVARFLGRGIHHICFATADIDEHLRALAALGSPLIDTVPRPGIRGRIGFLHPRATHGTLVELVTHERGSPALRSSNEDASMCHTPSLSGITIAVRDVKAAEETFARQFGLEGEPFEFPELEGVGVRLNLGSANIDLVRPIDDRGSVATRLAARGEGPVLLTLAGKPKRHPAPAEMFGVRIAVHETI